MGLCKVVASIRSQTLGAAGYWIVLLDGNKYLLDCQMQRCGYNLACSRQCRPSDLESILEAITSH